MPVAGEVPLVLHASAVAIGSAGLLITGPSGSGKSTLALQLMSLGAVLVSDDRVTITRGDGGLLLSAPASIRGLIEARGFGLLRSGTATAWAKAVVDLGRTEAARLPDPQEIVIAGEELRAIPKLETPAFPAMLVLYLKGGVQDA